MPQRYRTLRFEICWKCRWDRTSRSRLPAGVRHPLSFSMYSTSFHPCPLIGPNQCFKLALRHLQGEEMLSQGQPHLGCQTAIFLCSGGMFSKFRAQKWTYFRLRFLVPPVAKNGPSLAAIFRPQNRGRISAPFHIKQIETDNRGPCSAAGIWSSKWVRFSHLWLRNVVPKMRPFFATGRIQKDNLRCHNCATARVENNQL